MEMTNFGGYIFNFARKNLRCSLRSRGRKAPNDWLAERMAVGGGSYSPPHASWRSESLSPPLLLPLFLSSETPSAMGPCSSPLLLRPWSMAAARPWTTTPPPSPTGSTSAAPWRPPRTWWGPHRLRCSGPPSIKVRFVRVCWADRYPLVVWSFHVCLSSCFGAFTYLCICCDCSDNVADENERDRIRGVRTVSRASTGAGLYLLPQDWPLQIWDNLQIQSSSE